MSGTIESIRDTFRSSFPGSPFEFSFLDEAYDHYYRQQIQLGKLLNGFTFLAILISCLGLFGLASFMAQQRTKEIGIRKTLGASVSRITSLLSREFVKWVLVSNLIAWPVAYFLMKQWLQDFAYRAALGVDIFILSGLASLLIALLTVSFQSIRAATANPVDSLRYE